jgi:hypothetical protein
MGGSSLLEGGFVDLNVLAGRGGPGATVKFTLKSSSVSSETVEFRVRASPASRST